MHSVERSSEPEFMANLQIAHTGWGDISPSNRQLIRNELTQDFRGLCAYCEQLCESITTDHRGTEESVDHFRPREKFASLWLDWLNLTYSCRRCNQAKGNRWPTLCDSMNQSLADLDTRYTPVSEYVNPNVVVRQKVAEEFFDFNVETGEIIPNAQIDHMEWSMACRTIADLDLNDSGLGMYALNSLGNQRLRQVQRLSSQVSWIDDLDAQLYVINEFMLPGKPFSSFVKAYFMNRFPTLSQGWL